MLKILEPTLLLRKIGRVDALTSLPRTSEQLKRIYSKEMLLRQKKMNQMLLKMNSPLQLLVVSVLLKLKE